MASTSSCEGYYALDDLMKKAKTKTTTSDELNKAYTGWGKDYDADILSKGYKGPMEAAKMLAQKLHEFDFGKATSIIDLACGTGLVGEQLQKFGYTNLHGVDLNDELLAIAKAKGFYTSLHQGKMGSLDCEQLGIRANQYEAAICVGVLALAHVQSEGLNDLVYAVKPGGLVCFSIRDMHFNSPKCNFPDAIEQLSNDGKWKVIDKHHCSEYLDNDGAWYFVCQIM